MIFWDVDTQVDFLLPGGRLYVPGAERILPSLARLTDYAQAHSIPVISSACAHHPGNPEFEIYGEHCLVGTVGQQKVAETLLPRRAVVPANRPASLPVNGRDFDQIIVEKDQLDVFTNPNLEALLARFGARLDVVLYGVVTEICVACAARGLLVRGHRVRVVTDAVGALDEHTARAFLDEITAQGAALVTTADVIGPAKERIPAA